MQPEGFCRCLFSYPWLQSVVGCGVSSNTHSWLLNISFFLNINCIICSIRTLSRLIQFVFPITYLKLSKYLLEKRRLFLWFKKHEYVWAAYMMRLFCKCFPNISLVNVFINTISLELDHWYGIWDHHSAISTNIILLVHKIRKSWYENAKDRVLLLSRASNNVMWVFMNTFAPQPPNSHVRMFSTYLTGWWYISFTHS